MKFVLQIVLVVLLLPAAGCLILPVPAKDKVMTGKRIQTNDLAFVQFGNTTRDELETRIGKPWTYYDDLRVSVYYWEMRNGYWTWVFWIPDTDIAGAGDDMMTRLEILCVAFDEHDRVCRFETLRHPDNKTTKQVVTSWLASDHPSRSNPVLRVK